MDKLIQFWDGLSPRIKNIIVTILGILIGGQVNSFLVKISPYVIGLPNGVDVNKFETLVANIHLFEPKHFIMPFLAHALGTLVAAFIACKLAVSHHFRIAMVCGGLFFIGGAMAVWMIPAPMWFNILDLTMAYIPMGWLGYKLANNK